MILRNVERYKKKIKHKSPVSQTMLSSDVFKSDASKLSLY